MFSCCLPPRSFVRSFVWRVDRSCYDDKNYLMNSLSSLDETYREYSFVPTDDCLNLLFKSGF